MALSRSRFAAAALSVVMLSFAASPGFAQSGGDAKPAEPPKQAPASDANNSARERQRIAEAAKLINGAAGNPECVWHGTRLITLLWRNDLDTGFRHIDLYDRFGCPGAHMQAAFRCLARQGEPDVKVDIRAAVHACWVNPEQEAPQPAAAPPAAPAAQPAAPAPAAAPAEKR